MDFLLGEDAVVVDIPDNDTPKQSEVMKERATGRPCEPKEESNPKIPLLNGDGFAGGSAFTPPVVLDIYVPGWGTTRESLLSQHVTAYDWCCHAFPPATIETLELLPNSHLSNNLLYAIA